ncbi:hypothetical protein GOZ97_14740, partial [Agrobacterium vitis]|nr:hypothetical protein [Agrobacterium vitis]
MQRRVCLARAEEEHGGGADGAEAAEVFGGAHGQGAGVVGNAFGIEGGGEGGDGLRGVFAVQEDVVIGEGQAKAVLCGGCFEKIPTSLIEASQDSGATGLQTFSH